MSSTLLRVKLVLDCRNIHIFSKVYSDAMDQLVKGKIWLEHTMKMLDLNPWTYVGFVAFPNIKNRGALSEAGLIIPDNKLKVN